LQPDDGTVSELIVRCRADGADMWFFWSGNTQLSNSDRVSVHRN